MIAFWRALERANTVGSQGRIRGRAARQMLEAHEHDLTGGAKDSQQASNKGHTKNGELAPAADVAGGSQSSHVIPAGPLQIPAGNNLLSADEILTLKITRSIDGTTAAGTAAGTSTPADNTSPAGSANESASVEPGKKSVGCNSSMNHPVGDSFSSAD